MVKYKAACWRNSKVETEPISSITKAFERSNRQNSQIVTTTPLESGGGRRYMQLL